MKKRGASSTTPLCSKRKRGSNQMLNEIKEEKVVVDPIINSELKEGKENTDKVGICGICLEEVKTRGALNSCDHLFCFQCIYKWTKRSSTCPHCKRPVTSIKKADPSGKIVQATLPVRRRILSDTLDREEMQSRRRQVAVQRNRRNRAHVQAQARSFNRTNRRVDLNFNLSPSHLIQTQETIRNTIGYFSDVRALQESLCIDLNNAMRARIDVNMLPLHLNFSSYPTRTVMANVNVTVSNSNPYTHTVTQTTQRLTPSGSLNISQRTYSNMPRRPMMGVSHSHRVNVPQMRQPNMVPTVQPPVHVQMAPIPAVPMAMRTPYRNDVQVVPGLDQLSFNLNESLQQAANVWEHQMQNFRPMQGQVPNQPRGNYHNPSQFPGSNRGYQPRR